MYNLRSHKQRNSIGNDTSEGNSNELDIPTECTHDQDSNKVSIPRNSKKRPGSVLENSKRKATEVVHNKNVNKDLFNPKLFKKAVNYKDIYDSSDSESGEEFVHTDEDKDYTSSDEETEEKDNKENEPEDKEEDETEDKEEGESEDKEEDEPEDKEEGESEEGGNELDDLELDEDGKLDDPFNEDENEYFDVNAGPLTSIIVNRLKTKFPDLEKPDLRKAVKRALKKAKSGLVDEYCGVVPKDCSWKTELETGEVEKLEPELKQLRKNIKENIPTIPKILKSGLSSSEKERALQLYDALKNTEPYTLDHMYLSMKIFDMIRCAPVDLDPDTNEKLVALRVKMEANTPTVEKIMSARLTESDKIRALQLYEVLQQCNFNTDDWFDTKRRINSILDAQLPTLEEVVRVEAEESSMKGVMVTFHADLKRKIFDLDADQLVKSRIYEMYCDMISRGTSDSKYADLKDKIIWAVKLPYRKSQPSPIKDHTPDQIGTYCSRVYERLENEIYGMKDAKERVIQAVNDRAYNPSSRRILALKGKPGVGKTKLAKTIATAAGLAFDKISLGGAIDSTLFRGSDNVWSGASPSMLLQILCRVKCSDALILLDEVDKLASTEKGIEVENALLHVLDPSQNKEFQDSFLCEFPHDISKIWFVLALNDESRLTPALRDRLYIVDIPAYSRTDMVQIVKKHTLPEALVDKGITPGDVTITDDATFTLLNLLGREVEDTGMRPVEKAVMDIISKINLLRTMGQNKSLSLTFTLPDFKGFPYIITPESVRLLYKQNKESAAYEVMFT
ncbi:ATP-dependent Lon protease [uncultured virus]|nr:ATP-dependent Lon protease [uncultured virus]